MIEGVLAAFTAALTFVGGLLCRLFAPLGVDLVCYPFMQRALIAGVCVGVVAPLVGSFLVHRELALIGDTLAHAAFAGVAVGLFLGSAVALPVSPTVTALVVAVLAALLVQLIAERTDAYGDVSMAIVLSGGFALGTVLVSLTDGGIAVSINQYLFGSLSTVRREDALVLTLLSLVVVGVVWRYYRQFLAVTFDETAAQVAGVDVTATTRLLVVLTAFVVVAAMQIMGVILVAAMLVVPVATAAQLGRSFRESVLVSVVAAELAVVVGVGLSYTYGLAAGGTIVLVAIGGYGLALTTQYATAKP
ncbi:zinc transport system permease protein [Halogranum amylolyticum]|uniref:Zinc transport system permease protein n=1 Tax=Halogranum amylolyticum TaxID=660520 RepID=A0A1H8PXZ5_9EURY|nr:metal ABC transporter permease [Halogranum amylolyticum]SEO46790.1 zinc transport system permease protein [Halogranum amylolyticum]